ncbi:MAG: hypothetical protein HY028_05330 [Gammaproteobacteria bacterium]|nr:hypothetical protein [Gammaproteobacteria bacterium]
MTPLTVTPFCNTRLPAPAAICPVTLPATLLLSSSVPPFCAASVPLLVVRPFTARLTVPPETSAEMVPLLVRVAGPPLKL